MGETDLGRKKSKGEISPHIKDLQSSDGEDQRGAAIYFTRGKQSCQKKGQYNPVKKST